MKRKVGVLWILIIMIMTGCGNDDVPTSDKAEINAVDIEEKEVAGAIDTVSTEKETIDTTLMEPYVGFWFSEMVGPIQVKMDDEILGSIIIYIDDENGFSEKTIMSFEVHETSKDNVIITIIEENPGSDAPVPYNMELSKTSDNLLKMYIESNEEEIIFSEADGSYITGGHGYASSDDNESESVEEEKNTDYSEVESFEEEHDVNVVFESSSDLEVKWGDGRTPDIVVYEYGFNGLGREILEPFFESNGLTYYYLSETERIFGIMEIKKPIEERDFKVDILMDYHFKMSEVEELPDDILFTTPFYQTGPADIEDVNYYSFALPLDNHDLYTQLEDHIRELMSQGSYQDMISRHNTGSTIILPEGMDWNEFIGE